ncbi:hypothetical protein [Sporosarcina ureae]|uniref:hypothetical protein n=1 Tax=Sporosarcina ureae TaxID=1571 RepID=UPI0026F35520|nr:hypothetical protein [Sporosarcina ureae]
MNKELKIFFITSVSVIVFGGIYSVYHFQIKESEVANKEANQTIESPSDTTLPMESELTIEGEENQEGQKGTSGSSSTKGSEQTTSGSNTKANDAGTTGRQPSVDQQTNDVKHPNSNTTKKPVTDNAQTGKPGKKQSVAKIKSEYQLTVNNLQSEVDSELNSLINSAKKEYSTKIANGESVDYGYFYNKYMSSIAGLEAQTDSTFNGIMSSLEKDLQANGYDKSNSQSLRDEYEAKKSARRDSMQSEIMGN